MRGIRARGAVLCRSVLRCRQFIVQRRRTAHLGQVTLLQHWNRMGTIQSRSLCTEKRPDTSAKRFPDAIPDTMYNTGNHYDLDPEHSAIIDSQTRARIDQATATSTTFASTA